MSVYNEGDVVMVDSEKARNYGVIIDDIDKRYFIAKITWHDRIDFQEPVESYGIVAKNSEDDYEWYIGDDAFRKCEDGHTAIVYHDKQEEWICPFCFDKAERQ